MQIKIVDERDNPVLQRKELKIEVNYGGGATPKLTELAGEVAKSKGTDVALVEVSNLFSAVGKAEGLAKVKIWNSAEARKKFGTTKKKEEKPLEKASPKPEEKPKEEAKPEEKPKEEKKAEEKPAAQTASAEPSQPAEEKK